jgi:hypothetical protein
MKLKEKFFNWYPKQDAEFISEKCEEIADEFAIGFSEWCSRKEFLPNKGWFIGSYELEMGIFKTTKELLEIYKKEKGL